jgi:hypothetical protein
MAPIGSDLFASDPLPDPWAALTTQLERVRADRGRAREAVAVRAMPFRKWADLVPEARGPLDFGRFRYQRELYEHWAVADREAVFLKGNQVGQSTWALRFGLYHADVHGHTVLLTMPTDRMLSGFSRRRISPVIRNSAHLRERIPAGAVANVGERQVGSSGWLICRGTQQPIEEIDADAVVFDEYDLSEPDNLEASERRVTGPMSAGLLRRVGVPTVPGYGISAAFELTDQRVWTVKCGACGEQNPMRGAEAFSANVDTKRLAIVCRKCRRPLEVQARGQWVATYPDRDVRGYVLPKLIVPGVRLDQLVANSRKTRPDQRQAFYNRDLAEPYAPSEHRLSIDAIRACVDDQLRLLPTLHSDRFVCMGVDVAGTRALTVVIEELTDDRNGGRRVFVGEIEDGPDGTAFEQLCALMNRYGVTCACIDRAPERRFSEAFAAAFPGRVFLAGYFTPSPGARGDAGSLHVDDEARMVSVWRTIAIDATLERFRLGLVRLPPLESLPSAYPVHLGAAVRQNVELAGGQVRAEYRSIGPDDFLHSEVYCLLAIELVWRAVRLSRLLGQGPVPLAELVGDDYEPIDLTSPVSADRDWSYLG